MSVECLLVDRFLTVSRVFGDMTWFGRRSNAFGCRLCSPTLGFRTHTSYTYTHTHTHTHTRGPWCPEVGLGICICFMIVFNLSGVQRSDSKVTEHDVVLWCRPIESRCALISVALFGVRTFLSILFACGVWYSKRLASTASHRTASLGSDLGLASFDLAQTPLGTELGCVLL